MMLRRGIVFVCLFCAGSFILGYNSQNMGFAQVAAQATAADMKRQIDDLVTKGAYAKAMPIAQQYIQITKQQYGENHAEYGSALSSLGKIYFASGSYTQATPLLENALKIREKALGANHKDVAKDLENLAELYYALVLFDKADQLLARAKKIAQK